MQDRYCLLILVAFALLVLGVPVQAVTAQEQTKFIPAPAAGPVSYVRSPEVGNCSLGAAQKDLDGNNVRARLYNNGALFWKGSGNLYTVPKDGTANAIFAAGIWVGGLDSEGDLRFAGTAYGPFEYWPGPLDDSGNPPADCTQYDRMYKVSRADLEEADNGRFTDDIEDWPYDLGAPVLDGDGIPDNYDLEAGDRPELTGDQMVWWVMNDAGNEKGWSHTEPLGLEVQVTAFAFNRPGPLKTTTFYRYRLVKKSEEPISGMYFGWWNDPDLGNASDDFVGSDSTLGLGITYNGSDFDAGTDGYGDKPPALGYDFVQGPMVPDSTRGAVWTEPDGTEYPGMKRRQMTTFLYYNGDSTVQGNPTGNSDDPYQYLTGVWRDGSPMTHGGTGIGGRQQTTYFFTGNAADREFWSEENTDGLGSRNTPADRRSLMSTGPFDMEQGDEQEIILAIIWSRGQHRLASYRQLLVDDVVIQGFYQKNFEARRPLDAPVLYADEINQQIQLRWENPRSSSNYLHQYDELSDRLVNANEERDRTYSFEGYQVYQFDSPSDQEGELLATYDVDNQVQGIVLERIDPETGLLVSEVAANGLDTGVQEYHTVDSLSNYHTYYFGVRAYAYNRYSQPEIVFSPMARVEVTPARIEARRGGTTLNHVAGNEIASERIVGAGTPSNIRGIITSPLAIRGDRYEVSFYWHKPAADTLSNPGYLTYDFLNTTTGDTLIAGVPFIDAGDRPPYGVNILNQHGVSFEIDSAEGQFLNFLVTANAAGPITTGSGPRGATGGAAGFQGFPVPEDPDSTQQIGPGVWYYSTGDVGTGQSYENVFIPRSIRNGFDIVIPYDYEIRFTEDCYEAWRTVMDSGDPFATPANGCYAYDRFAIFGDDRPLLVPFELWNTGADTPDDTSDDFRMIPAVIDWEADGYDLQFVDSSISGDDNDPETDWTYWYLPCKAGCNENDYSPGTSGYERWADDILSGTSATTHGSEVMARSVFVNNNGGSIGIATDKVDYLSNVVNQDMPEPGTVFRLETSKPVTAGDVFVIDTGPFAPDTNNQAVALQTLDQIGIVPNPYRFRSAYQVNQRGDAARFTNLPDRATIRIFTLSGTLVRTFEKNSSDVTLEWDLTNGEGLTVASGMYLIHIEVPGVGEKVIKFGALMAKKSLELL